jgi:prevent-host-death family protein
MKTISQRELRNESGEIMRGLARGESYRVTSRGVPVGMLGPIDASELDELTLRPGTGVMSFPTGVRVTERTDDALAELRGD